MKTTFLILLTIFIFGSAKLMSQPWMKAPYLQKSQSEATFKDIQQAFNSYWGDRPYVRGKGYKQFKRWEHANQTHCYPNSVTPPAIKYLDAYNDAVNYAKQYRQNTAVSNWVPLGISTWQLGYSGYNPGNGRVNYVAQHPGNPNIIYIASPSGGIWKTTDGGNTWNTTYDQMTRLGTSCIAIHPDNPDLVFIGTGDKDAWNTKAFGIIKSNDAGQTWVNGGLNNGVNYNNINKILINPLNPQVMLASTPYRIYRTNDGGANWTQVYYGNSNDIRCMEYKPGDTTTIYCGGAMFLKSTDGGFSFVENTTLPHDTTRLEIGVSPDNSNYVYVLASANNDTYGGLYRSTDSGNSFTLMSSAPNIFGYAVDGDAYTDNAGQAWYDMAIAVSPIDANTVFAGGVNIWKSTNGGITWQPVTNWYVDPAYQYTHADIHYLGFYGNKFYCGSDGGVFVSDDYGNTWTDISEGLEITQFYAFSNSQNNSQLIVAGSQDNGSNKLLNGVWTHVFGADGFEALTHPVNDDIFYCSYQSGGILRTYNGGVNFDNINTTGQDGAWLTPIAMSPANPSTIWMGLKDMWLSYDEGYNWENTTNGLTQGQYIDEIAIAKSNPSYIYFSSKDELFYSTDNGSTWTSTKPVPGYYITGIAISDENASKVWVSASSGYGDRVMRSTNGGSTWTSISAGLNGVGINCITYSPNSNDGIYIGTETSIFYRDSTMQAWEAFDTNLPKVSVRELEIVESTSHIRAATYGRGIWESPLNIPSNIHSDSLLKFNIYPNPASEFVSINLNNNDANILRIFNAGGSLIKTVYLKANHENIDVGSLESGAYFFRFEKDGTVLGTQKVSIVNKK